MLGVAERKKDKQAQKPNRTGKATSFYMRDKLAAALEAYLDSLKPRPSAKGAIELALEEYLERKGFWPPPD